MPTTNMILSALAYALLTGFFNLLFSKKTQIEAWCAANPRLAAIGMLMRSVGFDPHNLWAFVTLFVTKKLPAIKLPDSAVVRAEVRKIAAKADAEERVQIIPGGPLLVLLFLAFAVHQQGCAAGSRVNWPKVAQCAQPLEQPLLQTVASVLAGTGDVKTELEQIALTKGAGVVECAVQQIVSDIGSAPVTSRATHTAARGRAFLESVQR